MQQNYRLNFLNRGFALCLVPRLRKVSLHRYSCLVSGFQYVVVTVCLKAALEVDAWTWVSELPDCTVLPVGSRCPRLALASADALGDLGQHRLVVPVRAGLLQLLADHPFGSRDVRHGSDHVQFGPVLARARSHPLHNAAHRLRLQSVRLSLPW